MNGISGRILRIVGILFFGLTTLMNFLGGIGTTCAAFLTDQYPKYMALITQGKQWLYQGLVIATVLTSLVGIWVLVELIRGKKNAFRNALIVLVIGTLLAGIQFYFSLQLFGKAAPANMKFYFNVTTLILFLLFLIPGVKKHVNFSSDDRGSGVDIASGLTAITLGILLLTTPIWAGASHSYHGVNWIDLLKNELNLGGIILMGAGMLMIVRRFFTAYIHGFDLPCPEVSQEQ
ncbi:MAG: hypothetical protein ACWGOY_15210 [Anaerolineales bacterium]